MIQTTLAPGYAWPKYIPRPGWIISRENPDKTKHQIQRICGIPILRTRILIYLRDNPDATASQITKDLHCTATRSADVLKELWEQNLVNRVGAGTCAIGQYRYTLNKE